MRSKTMCILSGACLTILASQSLAAISYSYVTDQASYNLSGGPATANVYLQETLTGNSTSLLSEEQGIYGGGFRVDLFSGSGVKLNAFSANPVLTGPRSVSLSDTSLSAIVTIPLGAGSGPLPVNGRILLGSITLTSDNTGNPPATFTLERYDGADSLGGNTLSFINYYDLDFNSASPAFAGATGIASFTAVVPEPVSLGAAGLGCAILLRRRGCSGRANRHAGLIGKLRRRHTGRPAPVFQG